MDKRLEGRVACQVRVCITKIGQVGRAGGGRSLMNPMGFSDLSSIYGLPLATVGVPTTC